MNADVQVAIDELDFGSDAVAPLRQLQTRVLLDAGVLQLQALQTRVAGGRLTGSTQLDANTTPARYAADLRFDGIDIAGWLRGLQAKSADKPKPAATQTAALQRERNTARQGGAQTVQSYLTGMLSGSLKATGAGRSTGEILGSLNGQAMLVLRDGTMSHLLTEGLGLDIAEALGVLVRGDRPLPLRCARFDLTLKDGLVQPRVAVLDSSDSTTRVQGQVSLRDDTAEGCVTVDLACAHRRRRDAGSSDSGNRCEAPGWQGAGVRRPGRPGGTTGRLAAPRGHRRQRAG